ncbi:MAG: hypothetical protein AAGF93_13810, partial [Cyanobacteria bacterium P01_H01_bin.105]
PFSETRQGHSREHINISHTYKTVLYFPHFGGNAGLMALRDSYACSTPSTAEYDHSLALALDASSRNRDQLSYQNQWAQYEQRLRDRDYQISTTRLKLDEIDTAIATLAVVRSPYAGRIRRIKWLGQAADGMLSAEVTLMVRSSAGASLPE